MKKEPRRQVKIYLQRLFLPPPSTVLANIHSLLASESGWPVSLRCRPTSYTRCKPTHSIPVQCWVTSGEVSGHSPKCQTGISSSSLLLVQYRQIVHNAGQTLLQHWVSCILSGRKNVSLKQHWVIVLCLLGLRITMLLLSGWV